MTMATAARPLTDRTGAAVRDRAPALTLAAAGVYAAGVVAVDPFRPRALGCPVHSLTGALCPGCGSTRAVHELLHGDLAGSLACHPLAVPVIALLGWLWVGWVARRRGSRSRWAAAPTELPPWLVTAVAVAFLALTVVRNVPGADWLTPPTTAP